MKVARFARKKGGRGVLYTPCAAEKAPVDLGKQLANLCGRNRIKKKAHVVRGQQIKWEIPVYE
jgi:hypothetical protein